MLYSNLSATNVVTKELVEIRSVTGTLRKGASIIDPVLLVEDNESTLQGNGVNYLYVAEFSRYYYVTNIISVNYTLWEIHCHVDVLMSYSEGIKLQSAVVARQERMYNLMLDDGFFMSYQNPKIQTKLFSVEGPFETQEFVLVVAGSSMSNPIAKSDTDKTE